MVSFLSQKETVVMAPLPLATPTTGRILCLSCYLCKLREIHKLDIGALLGMNFSSPAAQEYWILLLIIVHVYCSTTLSCEQYNKDVIRFYNFSVSVEFVLIDRVRYL
ncbi:unnamed protein product [Brassica oleracea var. botrytis]|uniref:(rape) hypothetical protein n=2 Tax=Brassica TaxID=3705 RepID=A0A816M7A9_BRANA|nr:unnamed protein product [Brassica napus]